jgi:hypothetical protein
VIDQVVVDLGAGDRFVQVSCGGDLAGEVAAKRVSVLVASSLGDRSAAVCGDDCADVRLSNTRYVSVSSREDLHSRSLLGVFR